MGRYPSTSSPHPLRRALLTCAQYSWGSVHVLVPFIIGIILIICFFVWELFFAKFPMAPPALFKKAPRTMAAVLLITFFSGANFFVLLLFWPTQVYNVYGKRSNRNARPVVPLTR